MRQLVNCLKTIAAVEELADVSADVCFDGEATSRVLIHPPRYVEDVLIQDHELLALFDASTEFLRSDRWRIFTFKRDLILDDAEPVANLNDQKQSHYADELHPLKWEIGSMLRILSIEVYSEEDCEEGGKNDEICEHSMHRLYAQGSLGVPL
jgi:hypothetical protein